MKVLILSNSLATGGAEKLLLDTIPLFEKKGWEVELALLNGKDYPFLQQLKESSHCKIHALSRGSVYNPFLMVKLIPLLKRFPIVHVHLFPSLYWAAMAKTLSFSKTKLLFTEHNTTNRRKGLLFRILDNWVYKKYSKIIVITEEVGRSLLKRTKGLSSKLVVIPNGVDLQKIIHAKATSRNVFSISATEKIILQVSSFTPQKDQKTLIEAIQLLPPYVHLFLVGQGPTQKDCMILAKNLGLESRVHFLGIRMDVPQLLKMADIVVLSSHFEGLSLASIEGMISGKPFIATKVPGLESLVSGAGVLVAENHPGELATAIETLLNNPTTYLKIANACQERALDYSLEKMAAHYLAVYKELW
ncbi:MAG: glycosyltransferase family 4 protein [Flavobacteriaceae bacterium]